MALALKIDYRLGGIPQYKLMDEKENPTQIPDEIRKCVVFVCCKTAVTAEPKPCGTAFFVGVPLENTGRSFAYLVTAKHVIDNIKEYSIDQKVHLRLNLRKGAIESIELPITRWIFHPTEANVDVAVLPWAPPEEIYDYRLIEVVMA